MRGVIALLLVLVCAFLAGCSGAPAAPAEVLIESKPPEEVRSNEGAEAVFTPSPKTRGHIAGVVVDEAIRPVEGASVHLPGLDLERTTDRDGSFGFVDLHPGPYFITVHAAGYYDAEAVLEVGEDQFTRAKVILTAVPPPEPYRVLQSFEGYTDLTSDPIFGFSLCSVCEFDFYVDRPGLAAVILEAAYQGGASTSGFHYYFYSAGESYYSANTTGSSGNPLRVEVRDGDLPPGEDHFRLTLEPESFPVPEQSKRFDVYVTAFYNEPPPNGWSFVNGDQP
ncbi:MAG TPA: carboxypeptidase-like regulatory domain-containing protein [Candidatus Thermoplasmatota archaeon]|nr:carboxypeptidase-like regulatory domain-containing protein [Candidatus Thermoplasmatota archaeon]